MGHLWRLDLPAKAGKEEPAVRLLTGEGRPPQGPCGPPRRPQVGDDHDLEPEVRVTSHSPEALGSVPSLGFQD